jgi:hypothetical protein
MPANGTERSVTTGRFQEAMFHWPLSGNQFWKATVASVPKRATRPSASRKAFIRG